MEAKSARNASSDRGGPADLPEDPAEEGARNHREGSPGPPDRPSEDPDPPRPASWLDAYDFELPDSAIARRPAEPRDRSRLLVVRPDGSRVATDFDQIGTFLDPGDLLVLNETRVIPARLFALLERTGREIEILLAHPLPAPAGAWAAMIGPGRRLRAGDRLIGRGALPTSASPAENQPMVEAAPSAILLERLEGGLWSIVPGDGAPFENWMRRSGHVPLPPYLGRADDERDRAAYQTVFARVDGAVAAPTAGLHFTEKLLAELADAGIRTARVILHVGPGTFVPVRSTSLQEHRVAAERYEMEEATLAAVDETRRRGHRVVAVGTTTVRALETAYRDGSRGWTGLTILPGHRFAAIDAMVTNFHLPRSSLLLLVCAFAGRERVLAAYRAAIEAGLRFYSYGDAMLLFAPEGGR